MTVDPVSLHAAPSLATPYFPPDGTPAFGVVGSEESFSRDVLRRLYKDHDDYARFARRLDELVRDGWFLADDAAELQSEAEKAEVP